MEVEAVRKHHRQLREYVAEVNAARPFNAANAGQEPVAGLNEANSHAASQGQSWVKDGVEQTSARLLPN